MSTDLLSALLELGAPWVANAVLIWLLVKERQSRELLSDRLYELGCEVVRSNGELNHVLTVLTNELQKKAQD